MPLRFKFFISQFIRLLFPQECLGCGKLDTFICSACLGAIPIREAGREKVRHQDFLDRVLIVSFYSHPLIPPLLEHYKYRGRQQLSAPLAQLFITFIKRNKLAKTLSGFYLLPLPLHRRRYLERGFNQSELLAREISWQFSWPLITDNLWRRFYTRHQTELKAVQRQQNIKGAFAVRNAKYLVGRKILLIDDVITTGASLNEAARALKQAGARQVWALVLAKN